MGGFGLCVCCVLFLWCGFVGVVVVLWVLGFLGLVCGFLGLIVSLKVLCCWLLVPFGSCVC